jgi:putative ABC transport system permease protein
MREWLARLRDWFRREELDREFQEELRFHRQQLERDTESEATGTHRVRPSRRRLGNVTRIREMAWERWSLPWLDQLLQDVRYALRGLGRAPGFTATVIATLALGIGVNAAMFGVIDRLMLRPYPYLRDPATVHRLYWQVWNDGTPSVQSWAEYTRYMDLVQETSSFSQYAGFANRILAVGLGDASRERLVAMVSGTFFEFFDAIPALGRFLTPEDDRTPSGADVAVLGYAYWKTEFGGRDVRGEILQVHNMRAEIIGVAPRGFAGVNDNEGPAVYVPITSYAASLEPSRAATYFTTYQWRWMEVMVRRKPGVSIAQASADASRAAVQSWNARRAMEPWLASPDVARPGAIVAALRLEAGPERSMQTRTAIWVTGVALIVLLIACANVTNLYLARALNRQRDITLRRALGVSRSRLLRQTFTESLVMAGLGMAAALIFAQWASAGIGRLVGTDQGEPLHISVDWRMTLVAIGIAIGVGLLTGLVPAMLSGRDDLASALKVGVRAGTHHRSRIRTSLLVAQGAFSVMLLVGAGLFVQSLTRARTVPLGYDADRVLLASRVLRGVSMSDSAQVQLGQTLLEVAQAIPEVEHAALVSTAPFWVTNSTRLFISGIDSVARLGTFTYQTATPDYFQTMQTRIIRGRGFGRDDRAGAPLIAVVSQSMAARLWPGEDALGQCIRVWDANAPCTTVVGIAEDIVQSGLRDVERLHYYLPIEQFSHATGILLLLRMRGDVASHTEHVRKTLQAVMPGPSYITVQPLASLVYDAQRTLRLGATMFIALGALALVVAAVGLYGMLAYDVAARRHELGVRVALGARKANLIRLVAGRGFTVALVGVTLGCALAFVAGHWMQPILFQQSARDPGVYGLMSSVLLVVALLAGVIPAVRASRVDPNRALRAD